MAAANAAAAAAAFSTPRHRRRERSGGFPEPQLSSTFLPSRFHFQRENTHEQQQCGGDGQRRKPPLVRAEVSTVVRKPRSGVFKKPTMIVDAITVEKGKYGYEIESCINSLSQLPPRGSVTRCMDLYRSKLTMQDFSLIFREFAARSDWHRALRLFKYMQRQQWCKPTEHIYTIMIGIMGREGLLEKCSEIFEDMPENDVKWNVYAFTALINAYGRNGQYEASLHLLARMKKEQVEPNLITYNTVLNACSKGGLDWEGLLNLFAQMRHEGIQPDLITYNTLLSACSSRGLVEQAAMVFKTMNESGVVADAVTYKSLVDTFAGSNQLGRVEELLREMEDEGNPPDIAGYNSLIEAYADAGNVHGAAGVFKQMQRGGCAPDVETYSTLLRIYGNQGCFEQVRSLFSDMKDLSTPPTVATYNSLIQVFGEGGYFQESINLFHDMVDSGVKPDDATYSALLSVCGRGGLTREAAKIHQHMLTNESTPSLEASAGLISSYGKMAMYKDALVSYYRIREAGLDPQVSAYDALIQGYAKGGLYVEAGSTLYAMNKAGFQAPVSSVNSVMEAYSKVGLHDEALEFFSELQQKEGSEVDERTHETLLGVYCDMGLLEEAKEEFVIIKETSKVPGARVYCLLLSLCVRRSKWDYATQLLDEMIAAGGLHQVVVGIVRGTYDADFSWQVVEYAFDGLKLRDMEESMDFYNALVELLVYCNQKARAARVLADAMQRGAFPEAFIKTRRVWSVNVHRMSAGATVTALSTWFNDLQECEKLPFMTSIVVSCGDIEDHRKVEDLPVAKVVQAFLKHYAAPLETASWNEGRIVCKGEALKPWLSSMPSFSETYVRNEPLPAQLTKQLAQSKVPSLK
ncbi:pentatricopeptide repeat-containing protein At1g74850, chloroplastic [Selaginella moellendorffii]|nr:pentatricopeptide repeat-containing protein At1g74850, chloroplastic [Selaginella moellendorffii]|eukprot:XP_002964905.2 pentatricopeptide repeat-containing protein At1g74850, chloroplastic [Selaginella moellendorffii]